MTKEPGYRLNVGLIVINHKGKLLLCKRKNSNNWQFPQGGIDHNEEPRDAAIRELYEEVGIKSSEIKEIAISDKWYKYDLPEGTIKKNFFNNRFKGQKQKWFIMRFKGNDTEINLKTKHPEFLDWKWIDIDDIANVSVDFKLEVYKKIQLVVKNFVS